MRRARLEDVASEVGVSAATVSLVLRGKDGPSASTRERVIEAAERLRYRPDRAASALASRRSRMIGVMMNIVNQFQAKFVLDIADAVEDKGYKLVLGSTTRGIDERQAIEVLLDSRCEALLLLGPTSPVQQLDLLGRQLPVVVVGRPISSRTVDIVRSADEDGIAQAVDHLVALGHERIGYVNGPPGTVSRLRSGSFRNTMRQRSLLEHAQLIKGGDNELSGMRAATAVLRSPSRPTALIAFNDRCAIGLMDTMVRSGVTIPDGMSVIGYDGSPICELPQINLTTVAQDTRSLAENAVNALVQRLDGTSARHEIVVPPRLVVRGTTAARNSPAHGTAVTHAPSAPVGG